MRFNDTPAFRARYWAKVDKAGECWLWAGATNDKGYGQIGAGGQGSPTLYAHRLAWVFHFGPIPEGMLVCHHCDTPACVRPDHLFLGTHLANSRDMASKGRSRNRVYYGDEHHSRKHPERIARGERAGNAKLTAPAVVAIRAALAAGVSLAELARRYGVAGTTIGAIKSRQRWKHIP